MAQSTYPLPPPPGQQFSPYTTTYGPAPTGPVHVVGGGGTPVDSPGAKPGAGAVPDSLVSAEAAAALAFGMLPLGTAAQQQQQQQAQQTHYDPATGTVVATGLATPNGSANGMVIGQGPPTDLRQLQVDGTGKKGGGGQHGMPPGSAYVSQKHNRLRRACDACSVRKVKCDEAGPPCRACAALEIPCTYDRPSKRRGPPNRHAEEIKRRRRENGGSPFGTAPSSPTSPEHAAQALAALSSMSQPLTAEAIGPIGLVETLLNDFFTFIHPLTPFPHEPTFREDFANRKDLHDRSFFALLASMIGALVASFPRRPRVVLKQYNRQNEFPTHMDMVFKCERLCDEARGPSYLKKPDLNVNDAATSYFIGLMGAYTFRPTQFRVYAAESLTILRTLGMHKPDDALLPNMNNIGGVFGGQESPTTPGKGFDLVSIEIGRRIFWTVFVGWKSTQQFGANLDELVLPPATPSKPYPPLPKEVDDEYIYPDQIYDQPSDRVALITGFNTNVRTYSSYNRLDASEFAYGAGEVFDWDRQKKLLDSCLRRCKRVLEGVPSELTVWPRKQIKSLNNNQSTGGGMYQDQSGNTSGSDLGHPFNTSQFGTSPRDTQYEVMKANIYASQLATRSYLVEKYWNLWEANQKIKAQSVSAHSSTVNSPRIDGPASLVDGLLGFHPHGTPPTSAGGFGTDSGMTERDMIAEREAIVKDLLDVLTSIEMVHMEPSADSFTTKIRMIASTLLEAPDSRKAATQATAQHEIYLNQFVDILIKLERVIPTTAAAAGNEANGASAGYRGVELGNATQQDEEQEYKHWTDLRAYQEKFLQHGLVFVDS